MTNHKNPQRQRFRVAKPPIIFMIQTPLPHFLDTLPILVTIEGHGSGRQGPSPLAPPEEPANE